jgi:hypothetical protein
MKRMFFKQKKDSLTIRHLTKLMKMAVSYGIHEEKGIKKNHHTTSTIRLIWKMDDKIQIRTYYYQNTDDITTFEIIIGINEKEEVIFSHTDFLSRFRKDVPIQWKKQGPWEQIISEKIIEIEEECKNLTDENEKRQKEIKDYFDGLIQKHNVSTGACLDYGRLSHVVNEACKEGIIVREEQRMSEFDLELGELEEGIYSDQYFYMVVINRHRYPYVIISVKEQVYKWLLFSNMITRDVLLELEDPYWTYALVAYEKELFERINEKEKRNRRNASCRTFQ